nr:hypothetical protein [Candidatus Baldrarchaeota archaeon]
MDALRIGFRVFGFRRFVLLFVGVFVFSFCVSLVVSHTLVYVFGVRSVLGGVVSEDCVLVVGEGSRSVLTAWTPVFYVDVLSSVFNTSVYPVTFTPTVVNGSSIVVRGVGEEGLKSYLDVMVEGSGNLSDGGFWVLVGVEAARRFGLGVGDFVVVPSLLNDRVFVLVVRGVYSFGDLRDYEFVVPLWVGRKLNGMGENMVSAVVVEHVSLEEVGEALRPRNLTIDYGFPFDGWLLVECNGRPIASSRVVAGNGSVVFRLPRGVYEVVYQTVNVTYGLGSVNLTDDSRVKFFEEVGLVEVKVKVLEPSVYLVSSNGTRFEGVRVGEYVVFRVPPGGYVLEINGSEYEIYVFRSVSIDLGFISDEGFEVAFEVLGFDGSPVEDFGFTIESGGFLVCSGWSESSQFYARLPAGDYELIVFKPPSFYVRTSFRVEDSEKIVVKLPNVVSNPERVGGSALRTVVRALGSREASELVFRRFIGLTGTVIVVAAVFLSSLLLIAAVMVEKQIFTSVSYAIDVFLYLRASCTFLLRVFGPPSLVISVFACVCGSSFAALLASLFKYVLCPSLLGYVIPLNFLHLFVFPVVYTLLAWLVGFVYPLRKRCVR